MLAILISIIVLVLIFGLFSSKSASKDTKQSSNAIKNWRPDDMGGLPWFGNKKRQRKTKKYYWD